MAKRFLKRRKKRNRGGRKDTSFFKTVGTIARRGYKIAKFVKSLMNTEFKYLDTFGTVVPTNSSAQNCIWLTDIDAGTGPSNRTGYSVRSKFLQTRFSLTMNASATTTTVRVLIFVDTNPAQASAVPVVNSVINMDGDTTIGPLSMDFPGRYQVLKDKIISLNANGNAQKTFKFNYNWTEKDEAIAHVRWDVTGDTVTDKRQNHIFMLVTSNQSTNTPNLNYFCRYRFIDN